MIDLKTTTETQKNLVKLLENRDWLDDNLKKVQEEYSEKWVAIADSQVVAYGESPEEVKNNIKGNYSSLELLFICVPNGEVLASI